MTELQEKPKFAPVEPFRHRGLQRRYPDGAPLDLAALNCEVDLGRSAITAHELSVEPKHLAGDQHDVGVGAARGQAAEAERPGRLLYILDRLERSVGAHDEAIGVIL